MSVHLRADGRWTAAYRDRESGKVRTKYFGRGLDAERAARDFDADLKKRKYMKRTPVASSPAFADLAQEYLDSRAGSMAKSTLLNLLYKLDAVIGPAIGHVPAMRLTPRHLDKFVAARLRTVSRTTVHCDLIYVQTILNFSVERKYITYNPVAGYKKPRRDDAVIMPPTAEESAALLSACPPHLFRCIALSYFTGLRPGPVELLSLQWSAVSWNDLTIRITSARKGGPVSRTVPMHPDLARFLYGWFANDVKESVKRKRAFPETIIHFRGHRIYQIKTAFGNAKAAAGITRRLRPYDFRHAFATAALRAGADLKATSNILGHSRPDTTIRIYQHVDAAMMRDTVARIPSLDKHIQKTTKAGSSDPA
jgi:integrase